MTNFQFSNCGRWAKPVSRNIIILDEIGKMECFSPIFKKAAVAALDSPNIVIGTITRGGDAFIQEIRRLNDIKIHEVTMQNRAVLPDMILIQIAQIINSAKT